MNCWGLSLSPPSVEMLSLPLLLQNRLRKCYCRGIANSVCMALQWKDWLKITHLFVALCCRVDLCWFIMYVRFNITPVFNVVSLLQIFFFVLYFKSTRITKKSALVAITWLWAVAGREPLTFAPDPGLLPYGKCWMTNLACVGLVCKLSVTNWWPTSSSVKDPSALFILRCKSGAFF